MTKEEWLKWREEPNIPIDIWFSFYKEKGGYLESMEEFTDIFMTMLSNQFMVQGSDGEMKKMTNIGAFNKMREYYDNKFECIP